MKSMIVAASFAALTLAAAVPALAETADSTTCRTLGVQTVSALSAATGDVSEARAESHLGMQACNFGMWQNGVSHYRKALSLLGK